MLHQRPHYGAKQLKVIHKKYTTLPKYLKYFLRGLLTVYLKKLVFQKHDLNNSLQLCHSTTLNIMYLCLYEQRAGNFYMFYANTTKFFSNSYVKFYFFYYFSDDNWRPIFMAWRKLSGINKYLTQFFQIPIKQKYVCALDVMPAKVISGLLWSLRSVNWRPFGLRYIKNFIYMCVACIFFKNLYWLAIFIRDKINSTYFKEHKKFFRFFFYVFRTIVWKHRLELRVLGIFLQFRGKLTKGGDTRKSVLTLKIGVTSLIRKDLCMQYNKFSTWTATGSVGCVLHIFY